MATPQELGTLIWNIKELIRDDYNDKDVDQVLLPFTLLRRLDCVFEPYRQVVESCKQTLLRINPDVNLDEHLPQMVKARTKNALRFYNSSGFSLSNLIDNPAAIADNFKTYLDGFSPNVRDILKNFTASTGGTLSAIYTRLAEKNLLLLVAKEFAINIDLHPEKVDNHAMGLIFEMVIRYTKEATGEKAGQFYTPRDIVRLLVRLVLSGQEHKLAESGRGYRMLDPCCGTGGMLTVAREYIDEIASHANVEKTDLKLCGQELNEQTYAICKADMLMKGEDDDGIRLGNTLNDDKFQGDTFDFMITNPPFGVDWKKVEESVKNESEIKGSRFAPGLPATSDGSLLFLLHLIHKMNQQTGSRIGIVLNASPLFNGDAGSGWSNIRKYIIDNDLLDAIVALPSNIFFGASIATYLWILDNKKPAERKGKVIFIDASHQKLATPMQRSLGDKRYEVGDQLAKEIVRDYAAFIPKSREIDGEEVSVVKILDVDDFRYTKVTVERPLRLGYDEISNRIAEVEKAVQDARNLPKPKNIMKDADLKLLHDVAKVIKQAGQPLGDSELFALLKAKDIKVTATGIKLIRKWLSKVNTSMQPVRENPYKYDSPVLPDTDLRDYELIPFKEDIQEYFEREVLPFASDAWMDRDKDKDGVEFPFTKLFYVYRPAEDPDAIIEELRQFEGSFEDDLNSLLAD